MLADSQEANIRTVRPAIHEVVLVFIRDLDPSVRVVGKMPTPIWDDDDHRPCGLITILTTRRPDYSGQLQALPGPGDAPPVNRTERFRRVPVHSGGMARQS